eukprot:scaffold141572_cov223-Phaeocystis_antarctica.AAC.1
MCTARPQPHRQKSSGSATSATSARTGGCISPPTGGGAPPGAPPCPPAEATGAVGEVGAENSTPPQHRDSRPAATAEGTAPGA